VGGDFDNCHLGWSFEKLLQHLHGLRRVVSNNDAVMPRSIALVPSKLHQPLAAYNGSCEHDRNSVVSTNDGDVTSATVGTVRWWSRCDQLDDILRGFREDAAYVFARHPAR
jgi:hypothetical protein